MFFGWQGYDVYTTGGTISYNTGASDVYGIGSTATTALNIVGTWTHFTFVMTNNTSLASNPYTNNKIYVNGISDETIVFSNSLTYYSDQYTRFNVGPAATGSSFTISVIATNSVNITKPVQVISVPPSQSNPQGGIAFSPFVEYSEEVKSAGYDIQRSDILFVSTPVRELENQYNQIFGSGIQIASSIPNV